MVRAPSGMRSSSANGTHSANAERKQASCKNCCAKRKRIRQPSFPAPMAWKRERKRNRENGGELLFVYFLFSSAVPNFVAGTDLR